MNCDNCGAKAAADEVMCRYCRHAISQERLASSTACPQCRTPNPKGAPTCSACRGSLRQSCVFCGHGSELDAAGCERCGEAFAGAAERKAAREADKWMGAVSSVVSAFTGENVRVPSFSGDDGRSHSPSGGSTGGGSRGGWGGGSPPPMDS